MINDENMVTWFSVIICYFIVVYLFNFACPELWNLLLTMFFNNYIFRFNRTSNTFDLKYPFGCFQLMQGKKVLQDFDIAKEAKGTGKKIIKNFTADINGTLEIHFYWAGKGTHSIPQKGAFGPLISAISVTPSKLSVHPSLLFFSRIIFPGNDNLIILSFKTLCLSCLKLATINSLLGLSWVLLSQLVRSYYSYQLYFGFTAKGKMLKIMVKITIPSYLSITKCSGERKKTVLIFFLLFFLFDVQNSEA